MFSSFIKKNFWLNVLLKSKKIRHFWVQFTVCKKCGKEINPKKGFWHWKYSKEQKGGFYHTECGMINNVAPKGFFPF